MPESDQWEGPEVARRFWAAINSQDLDGLIEMCDKEMELYSVVGSVYRGHEGLKGWWHELHEAFSTYEGTIGDSLTLGDLVLALVRVNASGRTSGMSDNRQVLQVFAIRAGKVSRVAAYFDSADTLEDAARQLR
ncbi:MAG: nuclear transport factor 2 family protein [Actinomycetota bacterium]|nr:nuclear transport factor 2 family protein [Actinomycetota bacterium]